VIDEYKEKPHMKFLKSSPLSQFKIGGYFPRPLQVDEDRYYETIWSDDTIKGSVILITSVSCSACNVEVVQSLLNLFPGFQFVLFTDGTKEQVDQQRKILGSIKVVHSNIFQVIRQLGVPGVPYALGINSEGQIVSGRPFDSVETLKIAIRPLLEVFYEEVL
jgi:hypothetical protein